MHVILISGKSGSGKDTLASLLMHHLSSARIIRISEPMKRWAEEDFSKLKEYLETYAKDLEIDFQSRSPLARILLQIYGTEIFQNRVKKEFWAELAIKEIEKYTDDFIIVPDVRWPHDIFVIGNRFNCSTVRITRPEIPSSDHPSEYALDDKNDWTYFVSNRGTVHDLDIVAKSIVRALMVEIEWASATEHTRRGLL